MPLSVSHVELVEGQSYAFNFKQVWKCDVAMTFATGSVILLSAAYVACIQESGIGVTDWGVQRWWWSVGAWLRPGPT